MNVLAPWERTDWTGDPALEAQVRQAIDHNNLSHGWLITGPSAIGKATFAYRIARAILSQDDLVDDQSLDIREAAKTQSLIAAKAHPDLFVAERRWDEKKAKFESEISVDTVRKLTAFLTRTASMGKWRVAIIDTADDLNRNAANALLKALEEPPRNTLILLTSSAPGRLIATIRSRCRRLDLKRLSDDQVRDFLIAQETILPDAELDLVVAAANGRPGYGLTLADGEGGAAVSAVNDFLKLAKSRGDVNIVASKLVGKGSDGRWEIFKQLIMDEISSAIRSVDSNGNKPASLENVSPAALLRLWDDFSGYLGRGEGLNLDRMQLILAMHRRLTEATRAVS